MVHTDETRASASEIKFLIDPQVAPRLRTWARTHLRADPHGEGPFQDEYETSSLYFDTRRLDVFHRRHSFRRAKYRVRRYGNADVVFFERKLRKPGILIKRRTAGSIDELALLQQAELTSEWPGEWFHRRLLLRKLRPVCQVSYDRMARVVMCEEGPARLTLDSALRAMPIEVAAFSRDVGVTFLEERMILELKFRCHIPAVFRQLVEELALEPETASKYRLAMAALGHVTAGDEDPVLSRPDVAYA